jgi:outer membrane beta-barrel protein
VLRLVGSGMMLLAFAQPAGAQEPQQQPQPQQEQQQPAESEAAPAAPAPPAEATPSGQPSCLDQSIVDELGQGFRRKGVQKRDFLKKGRFELSALGGFYASDVLSSTYAYGGALAFYPSEDFGLEVLVTQSPIEFRLEEPFSQFDREKHFVPETALQIVGSLVWSPMHAKFKFSEQTIVHGDVFFVAGAGRTDADSVQGLTWEAGAGLKLYLAKWSALRLDVRDFILAQEVLGRGRVANNVTTLVGVSVWFL